MPAMTQRTGSSSAPTGGNNSTAAPSPESPFERSTILLNTCFPAFAIASRWHPQSSSRSSPMRIASTTSSSTSCFSKRLRSPGRAAEVQPPSLPRDALPATAPGSNAALLCAPYWDGFSVPGQAAHRGKRLSGRQLAADERLLGRVNCLIEYGLAGTKGQRE